MDVDLVLLALGGVQRFISESRTTADVASSSLIIQRLAARAARTVEERLAEPFGLIYPVLRGEDDGVTSKIAFLAPTGEGSSVAAATRQVVESAWREEMVTTCFGSVRETPGMPDVWWVSVTGPEDDYGKLWQRATALAAARRRSRVFDSVTAPGVWLCTQSPRLPSVDVPKKEVRRHEKRERLSAAGWVKRTYERGGAKPATRSTASIASTSYRVALLTNPPDGLAEQVGRLHDAASRVADLVTEDPVFDAAPEDLRPLATRLGGWVHPEVWDLASLRREYRTTAPEEDASAGREAARRIMRLAATAGIRRPSPYYAVVMQDLDKLGPAMGRLGRAEQRTASEQLVKLGRAQREAVAGAEYSGVAVYTGGDDLLAFCPAATAITLARRLRALVDEYLGAGPLRSADGGPVTASTAVLFAHLSSPLQTVVAHARQAVTEAKSTWSRQRKNRDALAVVVLRRGGERARSIQPWGHDPVGLLEVLRPGTAALSGGLASQLECDERELAQLAGDPALHDTLEAELARLVSRRGGEPKHAKALYELAWQERTSAQSDEARGTVHYRPVAPLLVARFLAQECG